MTRFANERDRHVYDRVLAGLPAHHVIGSVHDCQYEARVDFAPGDECAGAILTEDLRGTVYVSYFRCARRLKATWIDTLHAHAYCCLRNDRAA